MTPNKNDKNKSKSADRDGPNKEGQNKEEGPGITSLVKGSSPLIETPAYDVLSQSFRNLAGPAFATGTFGKMVTGQTVNPYAGLLQSSRVLSEMVNNPYKLQQAFLGPTLEYLKKYPITYQDYKNYKRRELDRQEALVEESTNSFDDRAVPYSGDYESVDEFFSEKEKVIKNVDDLYKAISQLSKKAENLTLVWRGAQNAEWGVQSSLFRELVKHNKVETDPKKAERQGQRYPDENQMRKAERVIINWAKNQWRYNKTDELEIFARIQHHGGPTRLIDVTKNPLVATWFAVQENDDKDIESKDARLFAFSTEPVYAVADKDEVKENFVNSKSMEESWLEFGEDEFDDQKWGTGEFRRFWTPPVYDQRIFAQNAGFIYDGVPKFDDEVVRGSPKNDDREDKFRTRSDLLAVSSMYLWFDHPGRKTKPNPYNMAPSYTFRIKADAKEAIRIHLEEIMGYTSAYIYPDFPGLAREIKNNFNTIMEN